MKLDYSQLISPSALKLNLCSVHSPTLREIDSLPQKFCTYNMYLSMLLLDTASYYKNLDDLGESYFTGYPETEKQLILKIRDEYDRMPEQDKVRIAALDIFSFDSRILEQLEQALSFFICDPLSFSPRDHAFVVYGKETDTPSGIISPQLLPEIESVILQLNAISPNTMDTSHAKNKAAAKIIEKLNSRKKGREKKAKSDPKLELPNIISAVSACHSSINILNIWDLTVYQVYDLFARMQQNTVFDVLKMSVAAWGNKDNKVDFTQWFDCIKP